MDRKIRSGRPKAYQNEAGKILLFLFGNSSPQTGLPMLFLLWSTLIALMLSQPSIAQHVEHAIYFDSPKNIINAKARRETDDAFDRPLPARSFFYDYNAIKTKSGIDKRTTNDIPIQQNTIQLDNSLKLDSTKNNSIVDITSTNFKNTSIKEIITKEFDDNLQKSTRINGYDSFIRKMNPADMDNFNGLYQYYNNTYFQLANPKNLTEDLIPYSSYYESNKLEKWPENKISAVTIYHNPNNTCQNTSIWCESANKSTASMRDYLQEIVINRRFHRINKNTASSKNVTRTNNQQMQNLPVNEKLNPLKQLLELSPFYNYSIYKTNISDEPLFDANSVHKNHQNSQFKDDIEKREMDYPKKIHLWERRRGPRNENVSSSTKILVPNENRIEVSTEHDQKKPLLKNNLTTPTPFPSIMPGGQFYADQHVSYGQFGRAVAKEPEQNVVYDPNILESRYGFSGILTPSTHFVKQPVLNAPHIAESREENDHLLDLSRRQMFKQAAVKETGSWNGEKQKPMAFSAPNVAVTLLVASSNPKNEWSRPLTPYEQGAAYFQIPPPQKLSLAKSVPYKSALFKSQSRTGFIKNPVSRNWIADNKKNDKLFDQRGLLVDSNITEARRQILLSRLYSPAKASEPDISTRVQPNSNGNIIEGPSIRYEAYANNPLNWRPIFYENSVNLTKFINGNDQGQTSKLNNFSSERDSTQSVQLVPLPQLVPSFRVASNLQNSRENAEFESINAFDRVTTPLCYASEHLNDASNEHLRQISPRLLPAIHKCMRRVENCVFHMIHPLERRINFSEQQCLLFCGSQKYCISITYSQSKKICDVFNVRNGTGAAILYQHRDFRYYEMRRMVYDTDRMDEECWQENLPSNGVEDPPRILIDSQDLMNSFEIQPSEIRAHNEEMTVSKDTCPGDRDIIVFKSQGYRLLNLATDPSSELASPLDNMTKILENPFVQNSSEAECIFSCLINLAGGAVPYECMSATYNTTNKICLLYPMGNNLDGNVHLIPDSGNNHYEKGCITLALVELCKGYPIIRYAQKTLLGFAIASQFAASFIECLELCFMDRQNAHMQNIKTLTNRHYCKSVMYFYEENNNKNCILNSENRESAPAFFVDESEVLVDYASFENCYEEHNEIIDDGNDGKSLSEVIALSGEDEFRANFTPGESTRRRFGYSYQPNRRTTNNKTPTYFYTVDSVSGAHVLESVKSLPLIDRST